MTQATKGATRQAGQAAESVSPSVLLQTSLQQLAGTLTERAVSNMSGHLSGATERLTDYAQNPGGTGLLAAVTGIELRDSTGVLVVGNHVGGAPAPAGVGIHLDAASSTNLVQRNRLLNNATDILDEGTANCLDRSRYDNGTSDPPCP